MAILCAQDACRRAVVGLIWEDQTPCSGTNLFSRTDSYLLDRSDLSVRNRRYASPRTIAFINRPVVFVGFAFRQLQYST